MNICKTEQEYINAVAGAAQKACKRYGYLPSVLIAQSCLENGYGIPSYWDNPQISALMKYNNMVGIKSELLSSSWNDKTVWPGKSLTKKTPETYGGKNVIITDSFRIYDNIEQSFVDFLLFMKYGAYTKGGTPKYGDSVLSIKDPEKLIKKVHSLGYATGSTYSSNVMKIIKKHNLTKYDDLTGVTATKYTPGYRNTTKQETTPTESKTSTKTVKIGTKKIIDITGANLSQVPRLRGANKISFIVVHYLGVPNADNPYLYGGGYGGHFNIKRDGSIYKAAEPKTSVVWHCGGGLQGSGGHSFHGVCTNFNSIGIECGVCYTENVKDGDGDSNKWYFTEETQESLIYLVSKLMNEYNISIDHVIRHYDVTGKICPNPYVKNNNLKTSWTWTQFKNNLKQYRKDGTITIPDSSTPAKEPTAKPTTLLKKGAKGEAVKTMQKMLIACGYSCGAAGADGAFGNCTLTALKSFQKASNLSVDGIYGPLSKAALEKAYKAKTKKQTTKKTAKDITRTKFLEECKTVMDTAREKHYKYGNSTATNPTTDKIISCDRLVAKALYNLGFTDQRKGGEVCSTLDKWLSNHGFIRSTSITDMKKGSILLVKHANEKTIGHVFVNVSFNKTSWITSRYDAGTQDRINTVQPLKNVPWGYKKDDIIIYNIPVKSKKS